MLWNKLIVHTLPGLLEMLKKLLLDEDVETKPSAEEVRVFRALEVNLFQSTKQPVAWTLQQVAYK